MSESVPLSSDSRGSGDIQLEAYYYYCFHYRVTQRAAWPLIAFPI